MESGCVSSTRTVCFPGPGVIRSLLRRITPSSYFVVVLFRGHYFLGGRGLVILLPGQKRCRIAGAVAICPFFSVPLGSDRGQ